MINQAKDIPSSSLKRVLVDQDEMFLLGREVCEQIGYGAVVDSFPLFTHVDIVDWYWEAKTRSNEIGVIRYDTSPTIGGHWLVYEIAKVDDEYFRAIVQFSHCEDCSWEGIAVAPQTDCYCISLTELRRRRKYALSKCDKACPRCGAEIHSQPAFFRKNSSNNALI